MCGNLVGDFINFILNFIRLSAPGVVSARNREDFLKNQRSLSARVFVKKGVDGKVKNEVNFPIRQSDHLLRIKL